MELILSTKNLEPLLKQRTNYINQPSGFLTSQYKTVVKRTYRDQKSTSIFGIKQSVKSKSYTTSCIAATTIRLSLFLTVILLIFN